MVQQGKQCVQKQQREPDEASFDDWEMQQKRLFAVPEVRGKAAVGVARRAAGQRKDHAA